MSKTPVGPVSAGYRLKERVKDYTKIHTQLRKENGNATKCEHCNTTVPQRFEWALKKGATYSTNINDYLQLCIRCHRRYDLLGSKQTKEHIAKATRNVRTQSNKPIVQLDLQGNFVREYPSIKAAASALNIHRDYIGDVLWGNRNKTMGYKWVYSKNYKKNTQ